MRLYLSSFQIGNAAAELISLAPNGHVALIMNALDNFPTQRATWRADQIKSLGSLGFNSQEVDLRDFFGSSASIVQELSKFDLVWVCGGNAFLLRRAMKLSGFDLALKSLLSLDAIAYAGFSAGTVITAPSLRGLEAVDDPDDVPSGYTSEVFWDGLDILPHSFAVHYQSDHSEAPRVESVIDFYIREGIPYQILRDGEAYLVNGRLETAKIVGFAS